jgi:hypothetical protein
MGISITHEWVGAAANLVLAGVGVGTVVVAWKGLSTWRAQLHGTAGFDAARSLMKATYVLRDRLQDARAPFVSVAEYPEDYKPRSGPDEEARKWTHIYERRFEPVVAALHEFEGASLEAQALFGKDVKSATDGLVRVIRTVQIAMQTVIEDAESGGEDFKSNRDFAKETRAQAQAPRGDKTNAVNQALTAAVDQIEAVARPHLNHLPKSRASEGQDAK